VHPRFLSEKELENVPGAHGRKLSRSELLSGTRLNPVAISASITNSVLKGLIASVYELSGFLQGNLACQGKRLFSYERQQRILNNI